jgi:hypothetical protein
MLAETDAVQITVNGRWRKGLQAETAVGFVSLRIAPGASSTGIASQPINPRRARCLEGNPPQTDIKVLRYGIGVHEEVSSAASIQAARAD